jgi:5-methylthioadenosine/S-adenosylhomocysteine deaminase
MNALISETRRDNNRPYVIRNAKLVDADRWRGEVADILITGDSIAAVGPAIEAPASALSLEGTGLLIHPGFVNAHTHGHNALEKGNGDRWTLELLLGAGPWISGGRTTEDRYLSAALNAAEMALKGCTAAYDLFFEFPEPTVEGIQQAIQAYQDVGIRVVIAPMLSDMSLYEAVPGLLDALPPELKTSVSRVRLPHWKRSIQVMESLEKAVHLDSDRARLAISPTIAMHCSEDFLRACRELADRTGWGIHSHVAESKVQLIAGEIRYHSSIVAHLDSHGLIRAGFTAAHGVWLSDNDMERLAVVGASVATNPGSNMRLGNGLPDIRRMLKHGVNVAVGSDGSASSDNQNMYEAARLASYVSRVNGPDPSTWLTSQEAFRAATCGGSRALGFGDRLGRLAPGAKADLVFLDLQSINWQPLNNPLNQLLYTEDSAGVRHVMVGGRFIVIDRKLLTIDLQDLFHRTQEARSRLNVDTAGARTLFDQVEPIIASYCPGLASRPHQLHRYCGAQ